LLQHLREASERHPLFAKVTFMNLLSCKQISLATCAAMNRPMRWQERLTIRMHLMMCTHCRRFKSQMDFVKRVLALSAGRSVSRDGATVDVRLSAEARQRIKAAIGQKGD